jgi:hypothetical protein
MARVSENIGRMRGFILGISRVRNANQETPNSWNYIAVLESYGIFIAKKSSVFRRGTAEAESRHRATQDAASLAPRSAAIAPFPRQCAHGRAFLC